MTTEIYETYGSLNNTKYFFYINNTANLGPKPNWTYETISHQYLLLLLDLHLTHTPILC